MTHFNQQFDFPPTHLVTDMDGTFLPLPDHPEHLQALQHFRTLRESASFGLVYCTGRHFESVQSALEEYSLPIPDWIICDVGTSIYEKKSEGFTLFNTYQNHLADHVGDDKRSTVLDLLDPVQHLDLQCDAHQGLFKISYECVTDYTEQLVDEVADLLEEEQLTYEVHGSIDPFRKCGLIDVLPKGVSKAYAVKWLATHADFTPDHVLYAGDSGNDLTALSAGFRSILVSNASPGLASKIRDRLGDAETDRYLYCAAGSATSGVLEGCRYFGMLPE